MNVHNPPYFSKLAIILTTAQQNVFSNKLVAEKTEKVRELPVYTASQTYGYYSNSILATIYCV